MRFPGVNLWLSLALGFMAAVAPVCADTFDEGVFFYNYGFFAEAARCFDKCLQARPDDTSSAYYLANSYAHLGEHHKAVQLYRYVVHSEPAGEAAAWSRTALGRYQEIDRMRRQLAGFPPKHLSLHLQGAQTRIQRQAHEHLASVDHGAVQHLNKVSGGAEVAAARIKHTADAEIAALRAAKRFASSSSRRRGGHINPAAIESEIAMIREWAEQHQLQNRLNAEYRIRKHQEHVAARRTALMESAQNLEALLADSSRGVRLNPVGTNLYVRNYANSSAPIFP